jgi:xylulokinase
MSYLIGIELGTTRIKTGIFDLNGNLITEEVKSYPLYYERRQGKAESDPNDWWDAVKSTLKSAISKLPNKEIKAVTVGSHGPSLVALDKNCTPIAPSILWMDKRAAAEAELISTKLKRKSNDLAWLVPRALWIKNNRPELFSKVCYLVQPLDYINCQLTGEITATLASDFIKPWNDEIIAASGLDKSIFPPFTKMGESLGYITKQASEDTGLPRHTPVIAGTGGADFVEVYISSAILKKGIICDRGGTSQGVNLCWDKQLSDNRFYRAPHPLVPELYHVAGLMATSGKSLQWYKELYYGKKTSYDKFFKDAAKSPPGAKRLIFLPYLTGERTPWWDSKARGVFFGLSLEHKEQDIVRAILEGVGFGICHIINLFKQNGAEPTEIRTSGGQAKSPLWNQIKADITGLPIKTTKIVDSATLGLAIIAGKGIGLYDSIVDTAETLVKISKVYEPNKENHELYSQMQEIYEDLYPSLKDNFAKLKQIGTNIVTN